MRLRPQRSTLLPYTTLFRSPAMRQPRNRRGRNTSNREMAITKIMKTAWFKRRGRFYQPVKPAPSLEPCSLHNFCNRHFRSEEHTSELQSRENLVCRLLLEKK